MNRLTITKIPILMMLEILSNAFNDGADFFDIRGMSNKGRDELDIIVRDEYYTSSPIEQKKLTDEDLNQLI